MHFYKRKLFWIIVGLVVILIISGYWFVFLPKSQPEIVTALVEKGTLVQSVEASGVIEADREIDLSFESSGIVAEILVQPGDAVVTGQILLIKDAASALIKLSQAQATLDKAQANLDQELAGKSDESLGITEAQLAEAEALLTKYESDLANTEEDLINTSAVYAAATSAAEITLTTRENELTNTLLDNEQDLSEVYDDALTIMQGAVVSVSSGLTEADNIIGVDNTTFNTDFKIYLSVLNDQYLHDAKNSYPIARDAMLEVELMLESLTTDSTDEEIDSAIEETRDMLNCAMVALNDTRHVLDATTGGNANLTAVTLDTYKTNIDTDRDAVNTDLAALNNQEQLVASTKIANQTKEDSAQNAYDAAVVALTQAQANEADAVATAEAAVRTAEAMVATQTAAVATAQANLVYQQAAPRLVDTAALEAQVAEANAALALAQEEYNQTLLVAPFDGEVTDVKIEIGEQATAGTTIVSMLAVNEFQIVADVDEVDIVNVELNDPVEVTFDAFGDNRVFSARVAKINPAEKTIDGVVYYEVTVYLDEQLEQIRSGLSADLAIITENLTEAVIIPTRAVLTENFVRYVRVLEQGEVRDREVEIGVRSDDGLSQILSGVEPGEEIVVTIREK